MKLKTLIIDDEPIALEKLRNYVDKIPFLEQVGEFNNGFEASEAISSGLQVDLVITDISMPDLDGMELARTLPDGTLIVFITAFDSYAVESYRLAAVDYLLKPYGFAEFQRAATKAREMYVARHAQPEPATDATPSPERNATDSSLFVKTDYRYVRVSLDDIRFIKGYGEYLQIYVKGSSNPLLTLSSFAAIKEGLDSRFKQVHRSYIVNMNHVQQIERSRLLMDADTYIPVGESYKQEFMDYLSGHTLGKK